MTFPLWLAIKSLILRGVGWGAPVDQPYRILNFNFEFNRILHWISISQNGLWKPTSICWGAFIWVPPIEQCQDIWSLLVLFLLMCWFQVIRANGKCLRNLPKRSCGNPSFPDGKTKYVKFAQNSESSSVRNSHPGNSAIVTLVWDDEFPWPFYI